MSLTILAHPPDFILTWQPVKFTIQSDETETPLRIAAGVENVGGDSLQADGDKKAVFELSDYLQGLITERGKTAATPAVYAAVPRETYFIVTELVGDPPVQSPETEIGPYYLLDGYVPKSRRKAFYAAYATLQAYLAATKSCLSWWPLTTVKKVAADQPEFINFLQTSPTAKSLELHVNLTLS